jgi:hypothetical protein
MIPENIVPYKTQVIAETSERGRAGGDMRLGMRCFGSP